MPRLARIVLSRQPHHVTQRGNDRRDVFFVDDDRPTCVGLLRVHCERFGVGVVGHCLRGNHVHVVAVPEREDAVALAFGRTRDRYSQYVNRLHEGSAHV